MLLVLTTTAQAAPMTLAQLIERARANDHRVKGSQAQLRYLKAKYDEARWAWFPTFNSYFVVGGPTPEARNNALGGPPTTHATLMYDSDFGEPGVQLRAGVDALLPIYTFGKLDALSEAGAKGVQLGEALVDRSKDDVELQVVQAYWGYCLAMAAKDVIVDTLKKLEDASATLRRLRESQSDQVTQMDEYKLDYYRRQGEVQQSQAEAGANIAMAAIRLLVGATEQETIEISTHDLLPPQGRLASIDSYLAEAKQHRPELRAIEAGLAMREKEVFIRERMYYPDFGILGFFRWAWTSNTTRQLSPFAYDPYNELSSGAALVMRYTWDFPQKAAALEQARAQYEELEHQRDLIVAGVHLEVEKAWNETSDALARSDKQTQAEKSARRWATAAYASFDLGTSDTREMVDSFTALALSSAARYLAYHDVHVGLGSLSKAVGSHVELIAPTPPAPPPAKLLPAH